MKTKRRTCENKQTSKRAFITCALRDRSRVQPVKKSNLGVAPSQKISNLQTFALNRSSALRFLLPSSSLVSFQQARSPCSSGGGRNHQRLDHQNLHMHKDHRLERTSPLFDFFSAHELQSADSTVQSVMRMKLILIIADSHDPS